jgi:hypothetical protein
LILSAKLELAELRARVAELEAEKKPFVDLEYVTRLEAENAEAMQVIEYAQLTDGQMPSDILARSVARAFIEKYGGEP